MSTSMPNSTLAPIGSVLRWRFEEARAKDRLPAIYVSSVRRRAGTRRSWDCCEQEILRPGGVLSHAYIGTWISLEPEEMPVEPAQCPDLVLLGRLTLARVSGGVIIDGRKALGSPEAQFAVLDHLLRHPRTVYERVRSRVNVLTDEGIREALEDLRVEIGSARADVIRERYDHACKQALCDELRGDRADEALGWFGTGPLRDRHLAQKLALEGLSAGWTRKAVCAYLTLYGFTNTSGTVGRWYHAELDRLLASGGATGS